MIITLDKITLVLAIIALIAMFISIICDRIGSLNKYSHKFEMAGQVLGFICLVMFLTSLALGG